MTCLLKKFLFNKKSIAGNVRHNVIACDFDNTDNKNNRNEKKKNLFFLYSVYLM